MYVDARMGERGKREFLNSHEIPEYDLMFCIYFINSQCDHCYCNAFYERNKKHCITEFFKKENCMGQICMANWANFV